MIHVIATLHTAPGARPRVLQALAEVTPQVLAERGCLAYQPLVDLATDMAAQTVDEDSILMFEQWQSVDDLQAHLQTPHMLRYRERVGDEVTRVTLRILTLP
ncbi:antibiotic biosynthesis monooxygenase [Stutzerimonas nosocomialis]|uniref:Antibiotic biosynthesis monooxygenase n=1 Tax=Stutzerimonas nosocomialis TaxID=1056496 RepID=A0A5R9Q9Y7_9GAMM|nr:putative quinol monooxygenase [Stutzerimonas nosocomialis]TLX61939.1 antibiotic biosynthesis monooxygenase [Stutzerimonas nosocomialis]